MLWQSTPREILSRAIRWVFPAWLLLPLSWFLPAFDLTTPLATVALFLSDSGKYGMPLVVLLAILVVITREGISHKQRAREGFAMAGSMVLFLGIGALFNEHAVKPVLNSPRPNIAELSQRGLLRVTPEAFYQLPNKQDRSRELRRVLEEMRTRLPMTPAVREHWIEETGFSFPSGHSTASMLVATFFFCMALAVTTERRRYLLFALLPWAVMVCYARPVLRVHRPIDITIGALQGILLGILSFLSVYKLAADQQPTSQNAPTQG